MCVTDRVPARGVARADARQTPGPATCTPSKAMRQSLLLPGPTNPLQMRSRMLLSGF